MMKAVWASIEGLPRFVAPDFRRGFFPDRGWEIGEVGDDKCWKLEVGSWKFDEEIGADESNPRRNAVVFGVGAGDLKGF